MSWVWGPLECTIEESVAKLDNYRAEFCRDVDFIKAASPDLPTVQGRLSEVVAGREAIAIIAMPPRCQPRKQLPV